MDTSTRTWQIFVITTGRALWLSYAIIAKYSPCGRALKVQGVAPFVWIPEVPDVDRDYPSGSFSEYCGV